MNINKVSIVFICLREYNLFFDRFYDSCEKLFLRGVSKHYYVITDHGPDFLGDRKNVTYCQVKTPKHEKKGKRRVDKRAIKLNKFTYIDKFWTQIREGDYVFYFDADSVIRKSIRREDVIKEDKSIVGVVHGFGSVRNGTGRKGNRFEDDPKSAAYVDPDKHDTSTYYQSCLWGGKPNDIRAMVDDIKLWIEQDIKAKHKNKYGICDEVYVNKFFVQNKSMLHELDGRYASPSEGIAFRKGRDYTSSKEVMVSHECAAQNNTYRKFMNSNNSENKSIIFHFNGGAYGRQYNENDLAILEKVLDSNKGKAMHRDDVDVFTFDNKREHGMLMDSCAKLNIPVINLGQGDTFSKVKEEYPVTPKWERLSMKTTAKVGLENGFVFMHRYFALYHYLKHNKTKKYISLFDQPDTFFTDSLNNKIEEFENKKCGILFEAEAKCMYWPMAIRTDEIYPVVKKYLIDYTDVKDFEEETYGEDCYKSNGRSLCFLNGGGMMEEKDYFISFFEKYLDTFKEYIRFNDQTLWHHFHFCYYPDIQLDHKCEIFQCLGGHPRARIDFNL